MDKQKEILNAALKLFVAYGFHGTPTSKIANEAGVANGTLFHYYKTKDELVIALYNSIKESISAYLFPKLEEQDSVETKFRKIYLYTLEWALVHRDEYYYLQQFHLSPHISQISSEIIHKQSVPYFQMINEAIKTKTVKQLPAELIYTMVNSYIFGIYQFLCNAEYSAAKQKKMIQDSYEMLWGSLSKK